MINVKPSNLVYLNRNVLALFLSRQTATCMLVLTLQSLVHVYIQVLIYIHSFARVILEPYVIFHVYTDNKTTDDDLTDQNI